MNRWILAPAAISFAAAFFSGHGDYRHDDMPRPQDSSAIYAGLNLPQAALRSGSAVYSMECGGKSLGARLWLFERSRRSICIQLYSFKRNITGVVASEYVVHAADRGVKVRLLVDEASSRMNSYEIKQLNAHDNIEIRVYNAGLKVGRPDKRLKKLAENRGRVLRRMHNKLIVVDGEAAITGGRNISDEYFDFDDGYNFRDRDILMLGKVAASAQETFDRFWNDELSTPVEELSGKPKKPFDPRALFDKVKRLMHDTVKWGPVVRECIKQFPEEIAVARRENRFIMPVTVSFVSDVPGKNDDRPNHKGGITTDTILSLFRSAKKTIDIQTPYLVTTDEAKNLFKETISRGVKLRILTNSLASIDNEEAFDGYRRDRTDHVAAGVELFEFRPDPAARFDLTLAAVQQKLHYKPVFGLHAKSMVVDGKTTVIGSYNVDAASANLNTECFAVVHSEQFSRIVSAFINDEMLPKNAWRIALDDNPDKEASKKKRIRSLKGKIYPKSVM